MDQYRTSDSPGELPRIAVIDGRRYGPLLLLLMMMMMHGDSN